ncbi:MAG: hypothetical protein SGI83_15405 [Bacteroidota bacterium]|nr:hypothetical protein [Bacteroidota bacterium]
MKRIKALLALAIICGTTIHAQNVAFTCPSNILVKAEEGKEGATVSFPALSAESGIGTFTPASGSFFRLGSHSVIVSTAGGQKCSFTVTVTDNEPPYLSPLTLSRLQLWPASNKMKKVAVYYTSSDNAEKIKTSLSVSSNATDSIKDWEIEDENLVRLKSSRLPDGTVRIYTISVTATDEAGNKTTRTTSIAVSNTMTAKPGPSPLLQQ